MVWVNYLITTYSIRQSYQAHNVPGSAVLVLSKQLDSNHTEPGINFQGVA